MTVVIADSSPLNYLTLIGSVDVLHGLYGTVIVPQQVISELIDPAASADVRRWASNLPIWIERRETVIRDVGAAPGNELRVATDLVNALLAEDAERRRRTE